MTSKPAITMESVISQVHQAGQGPRSRCICLTFDARAARFDLSDSWVFKLEGHYMDGDSILMADSNPGGTEDDWFLLLAKVTYSF